MTVDELMAEYRKAAIDEAKVLIKYNQFKAVREAVEEKIRGLLGTVIPKTPADTPLLDSH